MNALPITADKADSPNPILPTGRIFVKAAKAVVLGGAWLFSLLSFALLAFIVASTDWGDSRNAWTLLSSTTSSDDIITTRTAWGLAYSGYGGCVLAIIEAGTLLAAIWLSTRFADLPRRIGLGLLLGWAALWLVSGLWVSPAIDQLDLTNITMIAPPFLFTAGRMALCWRKAAGAKK